MKSVWICSNISLLSFPGSDIVDIYATAQQFSLVRVGRGMPGFGSIIYLRMAYSVVLHPQSGLPQLILLSMAGSLGVWRGR